jgi:hypothetical protein
VCVCMCVLLGGAGRRAACVAKAYRHPTPSISAVVRQHLCLPICPPDNISDGRTQPPPPLPHTYTPAVPPPCLLAPVWPLSGSPLQCAPHEPPPTRHCSSRGRREMEPPGSRHRPPARTAGCTTYGGACRPGNGSRPAPGTPARGRWVGAGCKSNALGEGHARCYTAPLTTLESMQPDNCQKRPQLGWPEGYMIATMGGWLLHTGAAAVQRLRGRKWVAGRAVAA